MDTPSADSGLSDRITAGDVMLIAGILFLAVTVMVRAGLPVAPYSGVNRAEAMVEVLQDRHMLRRVQLSRDQTFSILGGRMTIEVRAGRVRVGASDCPQKVCVHTGWIRMPGQAVICVPHRVIVEIKAGARAAAGSDTAPALIDAVVK